MMTYRRNFLQNFAAITLILLVVVMVGCSKGYEVNRTAGEYTVSMKMDKNPFVGDNPMIIEVKDASGKYITDATVSVENSMPAMPGMPAMNYKTDAELKGNAYRAKEDRVCLCCRSPDPQGNQKRQCCH